MSFWKSGLASVSCGTSQEIKPFDALSQKRMAQIATWCPPPTLVVFALIFKQAQILLPT